MPVEAIGDPQLTFKFSGLKGLWQGCRIPFSKLFNFLNFHPNGICVDNEINCFGSQISSFEGVIAYICVNSNTNLCQRGNAESSAQDKVGSWGQHEYPATVALFSPPIFLSPSLQRIFRVSLFPCNSNITKRNR